MTWEAAMRWARTRARETGVRHRVYGYRIGGAAHVPGMTVIWRGTGWAYAVGRVGGSSVTFGGGA